MCRDDMIMERVLDIKRLIRDAPQAHKVCIVLGEQQIWLDRVFRVLTICTIIDGLAVGSDRSWGWETIQVGLPELVMIRGNPVICSRGQIRARLGRYAPGPAIREPELRNNMQSGGVRTTIVGGDANVNVIGTILVLCVLEREPDDTDDSCQGSTTLTSTNTSQ